MKINQKIKLKGGYKMIELEEMEKIWKESKSELKGAILFFQEDESNSIFIKAVFGDGQNLSEKDIEEGFDDYIYVEAYSVDDHGEQDDFGGGDHLFVKEKSDFYENLISFITASLEISDIFINSEDKDDAIREMISCGDLMILQFIDI